MLTLVYTPKSTFFGYEAMVARTILAILDYNENADRVQMINKEGEAAFRVKVINWLAQARREPIIKFRCRPDPTPPDPTGTNS